jgi:branched-chain amino acid transport system substrate-binding protein
VTDHKTKSREAAARPPLFVRASAVATLIAALAGVTTPPARAADEIMIAVAGPMTGHAARVGQELKAAAEIAVEDINAARGVLGKPVKLSVHDDACGPLPAATVALVIGHACTGAALAAADVYAKNNTLFIATGSAHPRLTAPRRGPTIFRLPAKETLIGDFIAAELVKFFPSGNIAVVHDRAQLSRLAAQQVITGLTKLNRQPATVIAFASGEKSYDSLIDAVIAADAAGLFFAGFPHEAAMIARGLRGKGAATTIFGTDTLAAPEFWRLADSAGQGVIVPLAPNLTAWPEATPLATRLKARGVEPSRTAILAYSAIAAWRAAVNAADSIVPADVATTLGTAKFATPIGALTFDADGEPSLPPYALNMWRDGALMQVRAPGTSPN